MPNHRFGIVDYAPGRQYIQVHGARDKNFEASQERLQAIFQLLRAVYPDAPPFHGVVSRGAEARVVARCFREAGDGDEAEKLVTGMYAFEFEILGKKKKTSFLKLWLLCDHGKYLMWLNETVPVSKVRLRPSEIPDSHISRGSALNANCVVM
ncbi:hypothetical protein ASPACDRAFT_42650 [Aspergillus aculeatus ATCC 16872]|uniref:Uncharacterized protein n=1 Tax=Aspergillus aculeatus (strain ATCC 16872 / CBS 172.66 / WB 5094) TaxID=690307 RepID=A0A1L9WV27_ASPA1|nr:uncharacterized protein ASPACDRAFT_42650 [Aspergillus aculeatus ATCC 16872]OJK00070.1 hypothetical protein ASPACDRAFT_42650 [Aspergillus aculeatus ATCC 16872]